MTWWQAPPPHFNPKFNSPPYDLTCIVVAVAVFVFVAVVFCNLVVTGAALPDHRPKETDLRNRKTWICEDQDFRMHNNFM